MLVIYSVFAGLGTDESDAGFLVELQLPEIPAPGSDFASWIRPKSQQAAIHVDNLETTSAHRSALNFALKRG
jgi:hypothetical protein